MTWSAAFPGVAVRVLRGAFGRRALQVGLLVGGLLVLGFLCGEQAQAAEGVGVLPVKAPVQLVKPPTEPRALDRGTEKETAATTATDSGTAKSGPLKPVAPVGHDKVLRPLTEDVVAAVGDRIVRPVGDLVETVTTGLTETVGIPPVQDLPELPTLPSFPESPSWPTLPTAPSPPSVPGLPGVPVQTLPAPAPAPVTSAPQPGPGVHSVAKPADDEASMSGGFAYGPRFTARGTVTEAAVLGSAHRASAHRTASTVHTPTHQAPADDQGGALGNKSAVDNGSPRHGDAHAITFEHRAPLWLVPGAAADVDAAGTRDRHRDIPVFPG
ncbi:hypothetical protein ABZ307_04385 [Streptomyces griseorubiginosus]|uniref:hypothetical protein n=1 Tax=Streptomyces griseorubiginosus TaxID=67304 RepID=UPI0033ACE3AE